jgi:hypothetical protein
MNDYRFSRSYDFGESNKYGKDLVSGLCPRYNPEKVPFGSVLIECVEDEERADWYRVPTGRYFYIVPGGSSGFYYFNDGCTLGRLAKSFGLPDASMYESGLEFYPDAILLENHFLNLYLGRYVTFPTETTIKHLHSTHIAKFKFSGEKMRGWFFERVKDVPLSECPFQVGDWVIYGKQLNRPDGYGKAARVGGVKFEEGYWQWWKDPVSKHLRRCEDYLVVAHDVEPMPKSNLAMGEAFWRPKYESTQSRRPVYMTDEEFIRWVRKPCPYL